MRIAALYDIHGNLPALEAVLAHVEQVGVDHIVIGGDVVPGPMPRETLRCLLELATPVDFIRGNGESAVLAHMTGDVHLVPEPAREAVEFVAGQLDAAEAREIASWPPTLRLSIGGPDDTLLCHATPDSDTRIFTRLTPESDLEPVFRDVDARLVVCGHTHMQYDRTVGASRVVNAGSVGMPFGAPGADWLLLDGEVTLQHTPYDLTAAAARIRSTRYPQADDFARRHVLRPPSESEMLALYSRASRLEPT